MGKIVSAMVAVALVAATTYRVYDKEMNLVEIWKDKGAVIDVYGPKYERKGTIIKKEDHWDRYDKEMNRERTIQPAEKEEK